MKDGRVITLFEAQKAGILRADTCTSLLEAQAACGAIIDPRPRQKGGERYYIQDALDVDLIPESLDSVLKRAEMSVRGL